MTKITEINAYEILDSRGNPTITAEVILDSGLKADASVPSGASVGSKEAFELRDTQRVDRYHGKGVLGAIQNVLGPLRNHLIGKNIDKQSQLDNLMRKLDGTDNKSKLGANAILSVSLCLLKAAALASRQTLYAHIAELMGKTDKKYIMPVPQMNIINGGVHADNALAIQEFMILPLGAPTFSEALRWGVEIFHCLKAYLKKQGLNTNVGDEGGFAPNFQTHQEAIESILEATQQAGYQPGGDIYLGLDAASNEFYVNGKYCLENKTLDTEAWVRYLENLVKQYPIISLEDGMAESDEAGWIHLTQQLGRKIQLVGDDLFVTNSTLLKQGIHKKCANAILIKLNQIGTVSETLAVISLARHADYATIISHRSGETEDTSIADLAVGTGAGQIKTGALCRTDRTAKYNRLLRIEAELSIQNQVEYAGTQFFSRFLI
ncbi:phosphopyruvate hydratase [Rickettsiella grylli]|uniref:Enolase n=1 Tax=Rickettsiella grylli TaxID=59196 RepID=A8PLE6_9COXI|nr:phosphopyruvate hydratase [Rickettsiella grylli]EDP45900.1 phosphopyruvate hydratase [Rickettsiella grylli]